MTTHIDTIAKEITYSTYDDDHFIYYLNGYRIVGTLNETRYKTPKTATSVYIHITGILDPSLKILKPVVALDRTEIGTGNGHKMLFIKTASPDQMSNGYWSVYGYKSLFDYILHQTPENTIDYNTYNEFHVTSFQYLDFTVHVEPRTLESPQHCVIKYIEESESKRYNIYNMVATDGILRFALTEQAIHVKMCPGSDIRIYENLFIWIGNQRATKKIQAIQNANTKIYKYKAKLIQEEKIAAQLREQIAELTKKLAEHTSNTAGIKIKMDLYSDLIKLAD